MWRDGAKHPSPNSGIPESGFAAYLGIQLGGTSHYQEQESNKPLLGNNRTMPQLKHIKQTINLLYRLSVWAIALAILWAVIS
jgi:adenosylcobinamide-phosphate synthase